MEVNCPKHNVYGEMTPSELIQQNNIHVYIVTHSGW